MKKRSKTEPAVDPPIPGPTKPLRVDTPAFPRCATSRDMGAAGMSLRDYFAGQAIIGYAANARVMDSAIDDWNGGKGIRPTCIAEFLAGMAYEVADKMLEARKQ